MANSPDDEYLYNSSLQTEDDDHIFSERIYTSINDTNGGNAYSNGQITFDLSQIANSGRYTSFAESTLIIPVVQSLDLSKAYTGASGLFTFSQGLKNVNNIINSISLEISNVQVLNITNFSNIPIGFRLLTESSTNSQIIDHSLMGFAKENADSLTYTKTATGLTGVGLVSNKVDETALACTAYAQNTNFGLKERLSKLYDVNSTIPLAAAIDSTYATTSARDMTVYAAGTTNIQNYYQVVLKLSFLHDIFKKLPLVKGCYARLIINTNLNSYTTATIASSQITRYDTVSNYQTYPGIMMPTANMTSSTINATGTIVQSFGIAKGNSVCGFSTTAHPLTSCRLICPLYTMSAKMESRYLQLCPKKTVKYIDFLQFQSQAPIMSGSPVNQLLTNGISKIRGVLVYPFIHEQYYSATSLIDTTKTNLLGHPLGSPYYGCEMTAPFVGGQLNNYNIQISGKNVYQTGLQYNYENFLHEIRHLGLNGGVSNEITSGLLSEKDFLTTYGNYYTSVNRCESDVEDSISKSVTLSFTNNTKMVLNFFAFVFFEREITINTAVGCLEMN